MANLAELVGLSEVSAKVLDLCTRLAVTAANNWYTGHTDLQEFGISVARLRRKEQEWRKLLKRYGLTDHQELKTRLDDAVRKLEEEEARVSKFQRSHIHRWWRGISSLILPDELKISIQRVTDAFDNILKHLHETSETCDLLRRVALHTPSRLPFDLDRKYVPLASTCTSLVEALEDEIGPDVIVLHGAPGTGKSSLARFLALRYQNGPLLGADQSKIGNSDLPGVNLSCFPDGVFFLPCGPQAQSIDCHRDLLLMLGLMVSSSDEGNEQRVSFTQVHERLHEGVRELSALMIFDDVWDSKLIESLYVPGRRKTHRKYLITSQNGNIWRNSFSVGIEDPALEDARRILAAHVGFTNKQIPLHLQPRADSMIERTGGNPLALASLALAVGEKDSHDERKWIAVEEDLVVLLEDETLPQHLMYPTSVASSIMLGLKSVPPPALELLYLASLCEGPVVPEVVMRNFHCFLNGGPGRFIQCTDYLENSSLVQVQDYKFSWTKVHQKTWSVHSMRQYFIRERRKEDLQSLTHRLLKINKRGSHQLQESAEDLVRALCAVYGDLGEEMDDDSGLVERASQSLGVGLEEVRQRKSLIKEFVWLLHGDRREKWKNDSHRLGTKVILHFLRQGDLQNSDLLDLLELDHDQARSTACWALSTLLSTEDGRFLTMGRYESVFKRLLELMDQTHFPVSQETAGHALASFTVRTVSEKKQELRQFFSLPKCLEIFVNLLRRENGHSYAVRQCAACILANLVTVEENKIAVGARPEAIKALADLAAEDSRAGEEVQIVFGVQPVGHAARALASLAIADDRQIALTILASHPSVLDVLIDSLTNKFYPSVRESAAQALAALQIAPENTNIIGANSRVFENLLEVLNDDENPLIQKYALSALIGLAKVEQFRYAVTKIFNSKESFVRLLKKDDPGLHETAAMVVGYLVLTPGCDLMKRNTGAALKGLVLLLSAADGDVSYRAITILGMFCYKTNDNKKLLLDVPGALEGLVGLLAETKAPDCQTCAATLLGILVSDNLEGVSLRVLAIPHALDRLIQLICANDRTVLDPAVYAALAIALMAISSEGTEAQRIMVSHPKLFESLAKLLDDGEERGELPREDISLETLLSFLPSLPMIALGATKAIIASFSSWRKSNSGLFNVRCDRRVLHRQAVSTLFAFASCKDVDLAKRNRMQILSVHDQGALRNAIRLLRDDGSDEMTKNLAGGLIMSMTLPVENKRKVAACPRVFETLLQTITSKDIVRKTNAACALSNLFISKQALGSLDSVPGALDEVAKMLLGKFSNSTNRVFHQTCAGMSMVILTASRANKLAIANSSTAVSSILQILSEEKKSLWNLPLSIRQMALQILANLASIEKNRSTLMAYGSPRSIVMEALENLLASSPEPMIQYLAAYTATRLDWKGMSRRDFNSSEALLGRANAGIEMKHYAFALADLRTLGTLERKPNVPYPLTFPHLWYSVCYAVFCIRVLCACSRAKLAFSINCQRSVDKIYR